MDTCKYQYQSRYQSKYKYLPSILLFISSLSFADIYWQPVDNPNASGGHGHGRMAKAFQLMGLKEIGLKEGTDTAVSYIHSDLQSSDLSLHGDSVHVKSTGKNNYHALVARQKQDDTHRLAVRYIYSNGRPVNTSPSDLLAINLGGLQIVPSPLPREHWKYKSKSLYRFLITFEGEPLAEHGLLATTRFGSNEILHTDQSGFIELVIPEDFPEIIPLKRATPPGEMQLFSSYSHDGKVYEASMTAAYHPSESSWKSVSLGALVVLIGLIFGFYINRKLPEHNRRKAK